MITLLTGGARSGKSEVAESLARLRPPPVTYVATGCPVDADMAERIASHRARRPPGWTTVEMGPGDDLGAVVGSAAGTVIVDSLGTWVAGWPAFAAGGEGARTPGSVAPTGLASSHLDLTPEAASLRDALASRRGHTILVSEEVGLGVHPSSQAGRRFRDEMGVLNRALADLADEVLMVVAGRVLRLEDP